jgi:sensor histidine kinase YesM
MSKYVVVVCLFIMMVSQSLAYDTLRSSQIKASQWLCERKEVLFSVALRSSANRELAKVINNVHCDYPTHRDSIYFFSFVLKNDLPVTQQYYVFNSYNDGQIKWKAGDDREYTVFDFSPRKSISGNQLGTIYYYHKIVLQPEEVVEVQLTLFSDNRYDPTIDIRIDDLETFVKTVDLTNKEKFPNLVFVIFFLGALSFIGVFMLFLFFKNSQRIYLYYSLFLIGNILYGMTKLSSETSIGYWFFYYPYLRTLLNEPVQFLSFVAYYLFAIELLNLKLHTRIYNIIKIIIVIFVAYSILQVYMILIDVHVVTLKYFFIGMRAMLLPVNIFILISIWRNSSSFVLHYFMTGALFFLGCSMFAGYFSYFPEQYRLYFQWNLSIINVYQIGVLGEVLCFSLALGYKIKLSEDERLRNQQAYIEQLQENKRIVDEANRALETKVKERTEQITLMTQEVERERAEKMRLDLEKRVGDMEMMALRSQMNPHFLFNSLNSIKYFILSNQNAKASIYLSRFSKLIRQILDHSRQNFITLEAELEALKLYLEIESNRFDDKFSFSIDVSEDVVPSQVTIPPMLLQPFVENAIWHGLLHDTKEKKVLKIHIHLEEETNEYVFSIEDNGIGRRESARLKSNSIKSHNSMGIGLIENRIDLINKFSGKGIQIVIEDLYDEQNIALGTRVIIRLKKDSKNFP